MAKLRHIALIVPDPEKAAKFFEEAFDMKVAGKARRGLYVSDGTVNVALLKQEGDEKVGIYHFGMWVDDLDEAEKKVVSAGGKYLAGRPEPGKPGATAGPGPGPLRQGVSALGRPGHRRAWPGGADLELLHGDFEAAALRERELRCAHGSPMSEAHFTEHCARL